MHHKKQAKPFCNIKKKISWLLYTIRIAALSALVNRLLTTVVKRYP